jgi:hypothetical protein
VCLLLTLLQKTLWRRAFLIFRGGQSNHLQWKVAVNAQTMDRPAEPIHGRPPPLAVSAALPAPVAGFVPPASQPQRRICTISTPRRSPSLDPCQIRLRRRCVGGDIGLGGGGEGALTTCASEEEEVFLWARRIEETKCEGGEVRLREGEVKESWNPSRIYISPRYEDWIWALLGFDLGQDFLRRAL